MTPNPHRARAKDFRRLYHELIKLSREKLQLPKVKLETPFYRGWERFFVLTEMATPSSSNPTPSGTS